jgi:CRP/FNR family transcriptional regulator
MALNAARFVLHRPELVASLVCGDEKVAELMKDSAQTLPAERILIRADTEHEYVYRLRSGEACRNRAEADGRDQFNGTLVPAQALIASRTSRPDGVAATVETCNPTCCSSSMN